MNIPRVSIGLVVRNGEAHLAEAIEGLLSQSFSDLEITVYDNASDDGTPGIAQRFSHIDRRLRLVRHDRDIGVLGNFVVAARRSSSPMHCWVAHDDVHEPEFLSELVAALDEHPLAALACSAVRDRNLDGTFAAIRPETGGLAGASDAASIRRLRSYLTQGPATPIYGVFRTTLLQRHLAVLERGTRPDRRPKFGIDVAFLASVVRDHRIVHVNRPLLNYRRGGMSDQVNDMRSLSAIGARIMELRHMLTFATARPHDSVITRCRMAFIRDRYLLALCSRPPIRSLLGEACGKSLPILNSARGRWTACYSEPMRQLRKRLHSQPPGLSVVIFGAGAHTRRHWPALQVAVCGRHKLIAVLDDNPVKMSEPVPFVAQSAAAWFSQHRADLIILSGDSCEPALMTRMRSLATNTPTWAIYDRTLEDFNSISAASTDLKKHSISSMASLPC